MRCVSFCTTRLLTFLEERYGKGTGTWDLDDIQKEVEEERYTDQAAFSMSYLEVRQHPKLIPVVFSGIALAFSLLTIREFARSRGTSNTTSRFEFLQKWIEGAAAKDNLPPEYLEMPKLIWTATSALIQNASDFTSPVPALLLNACRSNRTNWSDVSGQLLLWRTFGDAELLIAEVGAFFNSLEEFNQQLQSSAQKEELRKFLISDLEDLEPNLGLAVALA